MGRVRGMSLLFTIAFAVLLCRIGYIQLLCGEELKAGAERQQIIPIEAKSGRGVIYDRNMVRLTDRNDSEYFLIPHSIDKGEVKTLLKKLGAEQAGQKNGDYTVYRGKVRRREVTERLRKEYGIYGFYYPARYDDEQTAVHLIGYRSGDGKTGLSGLEKMYQYKLSEAGTGLYMTGDGTGAPVAGKGLTERKAENFVMPSALITTIDGELQRRTEDIMKKENITGAVVVVQAGTGRILAMASTPAFNPNNIAESLLSQRGELVNKATSGLYPPGSVFKTVIAVAGLESGKVTEDYSYTCTGSIEVNGVKMVCQGHEKGHGKLNMKEAFAVSCNCYFAHTAQIIGSETVIDTAGRMGIGRRTFRNFPEEEAGRLPEASERRYSGLANLSVGQGSLLVTPLQIAKMTSIIASGGVDFPFSVTSDGENPAPRRVISAETAESVGKMMEMVFTEGTASESDIHISSAGKTGSAEGVSMGENTVHGWFTGYFPSDDPAYVVTVIAEKGKTGRESALPVFTQIANYLY